MAARLSDHDCEVCKEPILYGHQAIISSGYRYGMTRPYDIIPHHFHLSCYLDFVKAGWMD